MAPSRLKHVIHLVSVRIQSIHLVYGRIHQIGIVADMGNIVFIVLTGIIVGIHHLQRMSTHVVGVELKLIFARPAVLAVRDNIAVDNRHGRPVREIHPASANIIGVRHLGGVDGVVIHFAGRAVDGRKTLISATLSGRIESAVSQRRDRKNDIIACPINEFAEIHDIRTIGCWISNNPEVMCSIRVPSWRRRSTYDRSLVRTEPEFTENTVSAKQWQHLEYIHCNTAWYDPRQ